jgi:hypothetical protein
MKKTELGMMPCRECGQPVKVMQSDKGGLNYKCMAKGCDDADYATESATPQKHASWLKRIQRFEDAPDPVTPTPKPAEKTGGSTFWE